MTKLWKWKRDCWLPGIKDDGEGKEYNRGNSSIS